MMNSEFQPWTVNSGWFFYQPNGAKARSYNYRFYLLNLFYFLYIFFLVYYWRCVMTCTLCLDIWITHAYQNSKALCRLPTTRIITYDSIDAKVVSMHDYGFFFTSNNILQKILSLSSSYLKDRQIKLCHTFMHRGYLLFSNVFRYYSLCSKL